ncbi:MULTISPECIES: type I methionyl aminopeptidase [unclassified Actinomyces]|uniref:type I methionyl aminopeptidase n=1 Tax=unclassified Actinomyces TaxID=2609248 RepID=UPI002017DC63|nr:MULTISPECIES: type I methionyl aminopeptidase [unclassified Actinomyces]MCL3777027.1 type I methionyl aminopeptidase [Actinomyces sp. AC-20-1]MCL3789358.1 type I methionyl aminopeptidase [Actinomyces sp. 187325]MCL3791248.1 type I methionyl aminopeptidase [Actinomyces sp. 186855]MCL3793751.1 type I methionyl aminopeptidase [Actinomyces sp. 217892]
MIGHEQIQIKTPDQVRHMRRAGLVVADIHAALREAVRPGVTTGELDAVCAEVISRAGAHSSFLGYYDYPATVCTSVNDEVVHGIPGERVLAEGDLITFDCGAYVLDEEGTQWHGDAAFTTVVGGRYACDSDRLLDTTTRHALWAAIAAVARAAAGEATGRGTRLNAIGDAVEEVVDAAAQEHGQRLGILEEYVGHGIGTAMHMAPDVLNYSVRRKGPRLRPGMVLAIEPMLTAGSPRVRELDDGWTVVTEDGSRAAQWEHTVAIVPGGVWVLTAPDGGVEGLSPYGIEPRPLR